jgi:hypothetical protein
MPATYFDFIAAANKYRAGCLLSPIELETIRTYAPNMARDYEAMVARSQRTAPPVDTGDAFTRRAQATAIALRQAQRREEDRQKLEDQRLAERVDAMLLSREERLRRLKGRR